MELNGHTAGNRLPVLSERVAPVQINYLGYAQSTGFLKWITGWWIGISIQQVRCEQQRSFAKDAQLFSHL